MKLEEKLKSSLTPQYSWLFMHVGRLERGVKFLVDLRTDVLVSMLWLICMLLLIQLQQNCKVVNFSL